MGPRFQRGYLFRRWLLGHLLEGLSDFLFGDYNLRILILRSLLDVLLTGVCVLLLEHTLFSVPRLRCRG